MIPATVKLKANRSNDYVIDRQMQKTKNFTGIVGINTQDFALQEGMGNIVDRSKENLGTSDKAIVQMRRLLLESLARSGPPVYATIGNQLAGSTKRPVLLCWILTTPGSYRPKEFHDLRTGPLALATDSHRT